MGDGETEGDIKRQRETISQGDRDRERKKYRERESEARKTAGVNRESGKYNKDEHSRFVRWKSSAFATSRSTVCRKGRELTGAPWV